MTRKEQSWADVIPFYGVIDSPTFVRTAVFLNGEWESQIGVAEPHAEDLCRCGRFLLPGHGHLSAEANAERIRARAQAERKAKRRSKTAYQQRKKVVEKQRSDYPQRFFSIDDFCAMAAGSPHRFVDDLVEALVLYHGYHGCNTWPGILRYPVVRDRVWNAYYEGQPRGTRVELSPALAFVIQREMLRRPQ